LAITKDGEVVGEHDGVYFYTIGQRHGFSKGGGASYYVVAKDIKKNLLIVADKADEKKFYKKEVHIIGANWINSPPAEGKLYRARIRYRQPLQSCKVFAFKKKLYLLKDGRRGKSSRESGSRGAESLNLKANSYKLVANIPYYLTSHLITELLRGGRAPSLMVLMVQKEVAERIVAGEGKENILSLAVKFYGVPKIIRFVKSGSFSPPPKVGSALLLIDNIKNREGVREKEFFNLIHAGFSHKRKLLVRNLEGGNWAADKVEVFKKCGIGERARAEDLTLDDWLCLSLIGTERQKQRDFKGN